MNSTIIGIAAGILTAISLLPQLIKLIRFKKANDISVFMMIILILGVALWVYYGALKEDWVIMLTNTFALIINTSTIILTLKYRNDISINSL